MLNTGRSTRRHSPIIYIAAVDSSAKAIRYADYVCDGTNDQVEFAAAIAALPAVGGTIRVCEGTYTFNDPSVVGYCLRITRDDIKFDMDCGAVIRLKDNVLSGTVICNILKIGDGAAVYDNIEIVGGMIDGNVSNNPSTGSITLGAAMFLSGPITNIKIRNVRFVNTTRGAIFISGPSVSSRAKGIVIEDCLSDGCAEGFTGKNCDDVAFRRNRIVNTTEQDGIEPYEGTDSWEISDNYFENIHSNNSAIDIWASAGGMCTNVRVLRNHIKSNTSYDIQIGNLNTGEVRNILVEGNIVDGGGIYVGTGATGTSRVDIIGNILSGAGPTGTSVGINMWMYAKDVLILGNIIHNHSYQGIVSYSDGVSVFGNRIFNNGQATGTSIVSRTGVFLGPGVRKSIVLGNQIYDDQSIPTQQWPVFADGTTGTVVDGNYFYGHAQTNYVAANSASDCRVRDIGGITLEKSGAAASVSDGGTINHGLSKTPDSVMALASVSGEFVSVTAKGSTTFTVAIKKHDGSAGTTQTIYWRAVVYDMPVH